MHELYELKEALMSELEEYGSKEMTAVSLDVVDKLAHTIKNLDKIIEKCEEDEYSGNSYLRRNESRRSYADGERSNYGMSGARRKRDSMGRYSRGYSMDGEMIADLYELMEETPNEKTKKEFQKFIKKIEQM